jgi:CRISPR-associated protein Csm5
MELKTHFTVTVEILAPVHIGDGSELQRDIDYVVRRGRTLVIHQDLLLDRVLGDRVQFDNTLLGRPVSELVEILEADGDDAQQVVRYQMEGEPVNRPLRTHIKDVFGRPYLPGSTVKGLLRTIYLWGWFTAQKKTPDFQRLGKSRSWAGQPIERDIMGNNANSDLFRAVQVSDSAPTSLDRLRVTPVSIYPTAKDGSGGVVVDVEALRDGTVFELRLSIDEYGFRNDEAAQQLQWTSQRRNLDRLAQFGRVLGGRRLAQEIGYYKEKGGPNSALSFYNRLVQRHEQLGEGQFLAQLGWGAGWNNKTLNDLLMADPDAFARLVQDYRLSRHSQQFQAGQRFPASRHLARRGDYLLPVGWVLVTVSG